MPDDLVHDDLQIQPFAAYLQSTNRGRTHTDLSNLLHELIGEVLDKGKAGSLTLVVKVEPDDVDARRLLITENVTSKLPQPNVRKSIFFADDTGNLTRKDPSQLEFGDIQPVAPAAKRTEKHA